MQNAGWGGTARSGQGAGFGVGRALGGAYAVDLPAFRGPLDLLLQLIEKQELDINAISLVAVTDQYLQTIEGMAGCEPGALADFLVVATRLLYIKSLTLLPRPQPVAEGEEEDPSDALIQQLLEYRRFKTVAASLQERQELGLRSYVRTALPPQVERQLDLSQVDVTKLHDLLRRALERLPGDPPLPRVKSYTVTVAEQIETVRSLLRAGRVAFGELLSNQATRLEVIVTFLAVLELIKQEEVTVVQEELFGEIALYPVEGE
jgi:segregation and condensation protein A